MKAALKKQYVQIENSLEQKFSGVRENELELGVADFKDGKLRQSSFMRLKEECWYIPYGEEVIIKLGEECECCKHGLTSSMEFFASRELSKIKKDRREARFYALAFFLVGVALLGALSLALFFSEAFRETHFVPELTTIISWTFVWAAVTIFFIDFKKSRDQRFTLLQLLSARVETLTTENLVSNE